MVIAENQTLQSVKKLKGTFLTSALMETQKNSRTIWGMLSIYYLVICYLLVSLWFLSSLHTGFSVRLDFHFSYYPTPAFINPSLLNFSIPAFPFSCFLFLIPILYPPPFSNPCLPTPFSLIPSLLIHLLSHPIPFSVPFFLPLLFHPLSFPPLFSPPLFSFALPILPPPFSTPIIPPHLFSSLLPSHPYHCLLSLHPPHFHSRYFLPPPFSTPIIPSPLFSSPSLFIPVISFPLPSHPPFIPPSLFIPLPSLSLCFSLSQYENLDIKIQFVAGIASFLVTVAVVVMNM